jgi:hypothetical protein
MLRVVVTPESDSDNSYPPDAEFEEGLHEEFVIRLRNPDREIRLKHADAKQLLYVIGFTQDDC